LRLNAPVVELTIEEMDLVSYLSTFPIVHDATAKNYTDALMRMINEERSRRSDVCVTFDVRHIFDPKHGEQYLEHCFYSDIDVITQIQCSSPNCVLLIDGQPIGITGACIPMTVMANNKCVVRTGERCVLTYVGMMMSPQIRMPLGQADQIVTPTMSYQKDGHKAIPRAPAAKL
jgi:hypothetical protein